MQTPNGKKCEKSEKYITFDVMIIFLKKDKENSDRVF